MKVLLVEPDQLSASLYAEALKTIEVDVISVISTQAALDELDKNIPDCIVLELDIEDHNGFEFLYEFSSQADWSELPIIVHSNILPDRLESMVVGWKELGVMDYLYKPQATLKDLQTSVLSVVRERAQYI